MSSYAASFPFKYCGKALLSGQVLRSLDGVAGDRPLTDLNYLREISDIKLKDAITCDDCGREFIDTRHLHDHRRRSLCLDDNGELLSVGETMSRAKRYRTDRAVIASLPDDKRKELEGRPS